MLLAGGAFSSAFGHILDLCSEHRLGDDSRVDALLSHLSTEELNSILSSCLGTGLEGELFVLLKKHVHAVLKSHEGELLKARARSIYLGNQGAISRLSHLAGNCEGFNDIFVVIKGTSISRHFQDALHYRPLGDIDLLLNPEIPVADALQRLARVGFSARGTLSSLRRMILPLFYSLELESSDLGPLDLHIAFRRHPYLTLDYRDIFKRSELTAELGYRTLARDDQRLLSSLSLVFDLLNGKVDHKKILDALTFSKSKSSTLPTFGTGERWNDASDKIVRAIMSARSEQMSSTGGIRRYLPGTLFLKMKCEIFKLLGGPPLLHWGWWLLSLPIYLLMAPSRVTMALQSRGRPKTPSN